jgi:hypothetical protein
MANFYTNRTTTGLLNTLRSDINILKTSYTKRKDVKIRLIIDELKNRDLTDRQKSELRRLVDKFTWI